MLNPELIQGCYWGLALGDALGQPVEFNQMEVIRQRYGPNGIQEPKSWAIWTDDTEMTFAVTRALLRLGSLKEIQDLEEDAVGQIFADEYIKWFDNPGYAPGPTCMNAVNFLRSHKATSWRTAGKNDSKGCGSVMRAAPVGLWFTNALAPEIPEGRGPIHDLLIRISMIQSEITHGHKAATAAALAGAYVVALAASGTKPGEMLRPVQKLCNVIHPDFAQVMAKLENALNRRIKGEINNDIDAMHAIGLGWVGEEAFAMALYAAIQFPDDFQGCLRAAVNHNGDSDSVGCIAGSIMGTYHGIKCIPPEWVNRLAEKKRMEQILPQVTAFFSNQKK